MEKANRASLYLDGIEDVVDGSLYYTDELIEKVNKSMGVEIPKSVTSIGESAFHNSKLSLITFEEGSNLETIGKSVFSYIQFPFLCCPIHIFQREDRTY